MAVSFYVDCFAGVDDAFGCASGSSGRILSHHLRGSTPCSHNSVSGVQAYQHSNQSTTSSASWKFCWAICTSSSYRPSVEFVDGVIKSAVKTLRRHERGHRIGEKIAVSVIVGCESLHIVHCLSSSRHAF